MTAPSPLRRRAFLALLAPPTAPEAAVIKNSVLVHEHVLVDFIGAGKVSRKRYDADEVFRIALPKLKELKRYGCKRMLECTPQFLGRDPGLLRRLEDKSDIELWTNTGLYGARDHMFLPAYVQDESDEQLAARWVGEIERGVEGSKPRFVKIGVNESPLNLIDKKLVRAAAITARETGVTVASHTAGRGPAALEQIDIFNQLRVPLKRFVWVHAQSEKDPEFHLQAARWGAWVEFDGINRSSARWHQECVLRMAEHDLLDRVLISQDSGWYHVGEKGGGEFNGYTYIYTHFLPGLGRNWQRQLMENNPREAFGG